jgi:hypothetical protein
LRPAIISCLHVNPQKLYHFYNITVYNFVAQPSRLAKIPSWKLGLQYTSYHFDYILVHCKFL